MDVEKVISSVENYDAIADGIEKLRTESPPPFELTADLVKIFGKLGKQGKLSVQTSSKSKKVSQWLNEQLFQFLNTVLTNTEIEDEVKASVALKIVLTRGKYAKQDISEYMKLITQTASTSLKFRDSILPEVTQFDDLRYFIALSTPNFNPELLVVLLASGNRKIGVDADLNIYTSKEVLPSEKAALAYRNAFQKAWLYALSTNLSAETQRYVLSILHTNVIINLSKPQMLMDFLTDVYNGGGALALLALNAVFVLIQYHNLDYPHFFKQLYALLADGSLLVSAHRSRFLRLLDLFMTSTHMPVTIPASILKRLARMCLFAPPSAIVAVVPFVYNQLKRHPSCMLMIHREGSVETDPFDFNEPDPLKTNAIESSLWELETLSNHAHPNVAAIAKIMSQPFKKPEYHLEHFLAHSYETMYNTERVRRRDKEPGLEYDFVNAMNESMFDI